MKTWVIIEEPLSIHPEIASHSSYTEKEQAEASLLRQKIKRPGVEFHLFESIAEAVLGEINRDMVYIESLEDD